jgi:hypothetical protein
MADFSMPTPLNAQAGTAVPKTGNRNVAVFNDKGVKYQSVEHTALANTFY